MENLKDSTLDSLNAELGILPDINTSDDDLIHELTKLSEMEYQRRRKQAAKTLGISVIALDKLVKQTSKEMNSKADDIFPIIELWPEPVILSTLLDELAETVNRFLVFPSQHEAKAIALWIIHTHCLEAANVSPILNINSPEKRCGKTTLLTVLQRLIYRPLVASNITPAAIYRAIEKWKPTFVIDEADTFMCENEELRGVINSGHARNSAYVIRCVGDNHEPTRFCTWCPKVIAGIGNLAETIEDRSIVIRLRRKLPDERKEQLRDVPQSIFDDLLRKCMRFATDYMEQLSEARPDIPASLNDRAADNWRPLLAIAELTSDDWLKGAIEAAHHLSSSKQEVVSVGVELLQDIKDIFAEKRIDRIATSDLLEALCNDSEAPWATYNRGKPMTARQLANRLKEFRILSTTIRFSPVEIKKGYTRESFEDAFHRYISSSDLPQALQSVTTLQAYSHAGSVTHTQTLQNEMLRIETQLETLPSMVCNVVTDRSGVLDNIEKENEREVFIL